MKLTDFDYTVNWEKTKINIRYRLLGKATAQNLEDIFGVNARAIQNKLNPKSKTELNISELASLSRYLRCEIEDLIIFEGDSSINVPLSKKDLYGYNEDTSPDSVNHNVRFFEKFDSECQIKDIYEFLLYLPLVEEYELKNVVYRSVTNLNLNRDYVKIQLSCLYESIPDSPAKQYADLYRDNILRLKGPPAVKEFSDDYPVYFLNDYLDAAREYLLGKDFDERSLYDE